MSGPLDEALGNLDPNSLGEALRRTENRQPDEAKIEFLASGPHELPLQEVTGVLTRDPVRSYQRHVSPHTCAVAVVDGVVHPMTMCSRFIAIPQDRAFGEVPEGEQCPECVNSITLEF